MSVVNNKTEDLSAIAYNVLKEYEIAPDKVTVIQGGTIKTVWRVSSGGINYCLKRLKQTIDKALFSVHAQIHIRDSGGLVRDHLNKAESRSPDTMTSYLSCMNGSTGKTWFSLFPPIFGPLYRVWPISIWPRRAIKPLKVPGFLQSSANGLINICP